MYSGRWERIYLIISLHTVCLAIFVACWLTSRILVESHIFQIPLTSHFYLIPWSLSESSQLCHPDSLCSRRTKMHSGREEQIWVKCFPLALPQYRYLMMSSDIINSLVNKMGAHLHAGEQNCTQKTGTIYIPWYYLLYRSDTGGDSLLADCEIGFRKTETKHAMCPLMCGLLSNSLYLGGNHFCPATFPYMYLLWPSNAVELSAHKIVNGKYHHVIFGGCKFFRTPGEKKRLQE